jgi:putative redox protein
MSTRHVSARWDGGQSAVTDIRGMRLAIGEDAPPLGTTSAPLPTEVLLASVASCFAIALAFVAAKRKLELPGLQVDVDGSYDGPRLAAIDISVSSDADPDLVNKLIPSAERLCYVTNTLRKPPQITISQHPRA